MDVLTRLDHEIVADPAVSSGARGVEEHLATNPAVQAADPRQVAGDRAQAAALDREVRVLEPLGATTADVAAVLGRGHFLLNWTTGCSPEASA